MSSEVKLYVLSALPRTAQAVEPRGLSIQSVGCARRSSPRRADGQNADSKLSLMRKDYSPVAASADTGWPLAHKGSRELQPQDAGCAAVYRRKW